MVHGYNSISIELIVIYLCIQLLKYSNDILIHLNSLDLNSRPNIYLEFKLPRLIFRNTSTNVIRSLEQLIYPVNQCV